MTLREGSLFLQSNSKKRYVEADLVILGGKILAKSDQTTSVNLRRGALVTPLVAVREITQQSMCL